MVRVVSVLALAAAVVAAVAKVAVERATALWATSGALRFDELVTAGALAVLTGVGAWLTMATALTALTALTHTRRHAASGLARLAHRVTPRLCRTAVQMCLGGACGAALIASPVVAGAAQAVTAGGPDRGLPAAAATPAGRAADVDRLPLPLPDRPHPGAAGVRVRLGDTLWAIAARHLPRTASDAAIDAAWPRWFAANRDRLGPDPDLIRPGTRLTVPHATHAAHPVDKDL